VLRPLTVVAGSPPEGPPQRVFSAESASLIGDILSDPEARRLEFGRGSLLSLPLQTAVKTGTSTDYRDAWALGVNHRYVVGVGMGNLDARPMREVTGAAGPALVLRSVFSELNRNEEGRGLFLSPRLAAVDICRGSGLRAAPRCPTLREWFAPGTEPAACALRHDGSGDEPEPVRIAAPDGALRLRQPTAGLQLALDPRIPDELEAFAFELPAGMRAVRVQWLVDGEVAGETAAGAESFLWPLPPGRHTALARLWPENGTAPVETEAVTFTVK
jgi:penicillin-binding protein 1C